MYDFVIVGAGSAGCVLAEGLSARHSVLLLEAGGSNRSRHVVIPAAFSKNFNSRRDWGLYSEPDRSLAGRRLYLPRGKMLGGSGSMNAMIYIRGRPSDYDSWAEAGADGWSWREVLEVFKTMEANSRGASDYHGAGGPLRVEDLRNPNPFSRRFVAAAIEVGIPPNPDFNGATQEGVGFFQVTQKRGRRWSAADAYLRPAMARPTLHLVTGARVSRVVTEGAAAIGVEYIKDGQRKIAHCEGEVILAAGAFGSPHLLQLSGVGDPDHLRSLGIETVAANRNVGRHLQDHPVIGLLHRSTSSGTLDDAENLVQLFKWLLLRRGKLTSNVAEAGAFVRSSDDLDEPDLQFHFGPANFDDHGRLGFDGHAYTFGPVLVNPIGRGSVMARSPDPSHPPAIRGDYLAESQDLQALVRGLELAREIAAAEAFSDVRGEEIVPGPHVSGYDDIVRFIKEKAELLYHPAGTCRMGGPDDSVVDSDLRVRGLEGLRVADASVMPTVTSGNTNTPTMMIAARAVERILAR